MLHKASMHQFRDENHSSNYDFLHLGAASFMTCPRDFGSLTVCSYIDVFLMCEGDRHVVVSALDR